MLLLVAITKQKQQATNTKMFTYYISETSNVLIN